MAVIFDISGDSNDGGGPNKNPGDEGKKPQEQQVVVAKTGRIPNPLPDALLVSIFALLGRCNYPKLSLVCRDFHNVINTSPELYKERLKLGNTESVLYAMIGFPPFQLPAWYILNNTNGSSRLIRIENLADVPYGSAVVTIGLDMYVIGGCVGLLMCTSAVFRIDCRSHKFIQLPSMRRARSHPAAGVIDEKIYVIGGCQMTVGMTDWVEVFDVKTRRWNPVPGPYVYHSAGAQFVTSAVMGEKIYVLDHLSCFTYEPKKNKWETLLGEGRSLVCPLRTLWMRPSCLIDDVLYTIDHTGYFQHNNFVAFDPKENYWRPVTIMRPPFPLPPPLFYCDSEMANSGGNLVILAGNKSHYISNLAEVKEIWCVEITLERQEDGEFRGTIIRSECVFTSHNAPYIEHCRALTV